MNHLLIIPAQCYSQLFLLPLSPLRFFEVETRVHIFCILLLFLSLFIFINDFCNPLGGWKGMLFVNNINVIWDSNITAIKISNKYYLSFYVDFAAWFWSSCSHISTFNSSSTWSSISWPYFGPDWIFSRSKNNCVSSISDVI